MGLVWVTGISGSGKSAVCRELEGRGHRAIDADWEGFSAWVHRRTGDVLVDAPYPVPSGWLAEYAWKIDVDDSAVTTLRWRNMSAAECSPAEPRLHSHLLFVLGVTL